jgi:predicted nuclease of predicted toxin-antitoxin system
VKILIDAQLPPALKLLLNGAGNEAFHVADLGLRNASDAAVWDHAFREGMIIFTKDEDFAGRRLRKIGGPIVVWLRLGNASRMALVRWLMPLLPAIEQLVQAGDSLIEVR